MILERTGRLWGEEKVLTSKEKRKKAWGRGGAHLVP